MPDYLTIALSVGAFLIVVWALTYGYAHIRQVNDDMAERELDRERDYLALDRERIVVTPDGTYHLRRLPDGTIEVEPIGGRAARIPPALPAQQTMTARTNGHVTGEYPIMPAGPMAAQDLDPNRQLVRDLLEAALVKRNDESREIPGHKELGWPYDPWKAATTLLGPLIAMGQGKGTWIVEGGPFPNLRQLYWGVCLYRVDLRPPAPALRREADKQPA